MNTNTETSSTYEQQRDEFEMAIRTLTTVPPTGYKWEAFRDQYVEQVVLYTGSGSDRLTEAWHITLTVARTALNDWNEDN